MFDNKIYPIIVTPMTTTVDGRIHLLHRTRVIEISSKQSKEILPILSECSGHYCVEEIAKKSGIPFDVVFSVIKQLIDLEIIVDSRKQYIHFHRISSYPMCFGTMITREDIKAYTKSKRYPCKKGPIKKYYNLDLDLEVLLKKRFSCRAFSDEKLSFNQIGSICHCGGFVKAGYIPSGGALYPIKIYVLVEKEQLDLPYGYYEYNTEQDEFVLFSEEVDEEKLKHCFNSECLPFNSSVQIIIAADLERQTNKYGNRGYRFTLMEAGHVAENVCLACTELGVGSCELGGILDEPLRKELELEDEIFPLIAIAIGKECQEHEEKIDELEYLRKKGLLVDEYGAKAFGKNASFFGAYAKYGMTSNEFAGATSLSYEHAVFKANIEAYERKISGCAKVDFIGTAMELEKNSKNWLNPNDYVPLEIGQCEMNNINRFHNRLEIEWTKGYSYESGDDIYIPTDIVFYGHQHYKNTIYYGCSSGVAADFNEIGAEKRALTELIERDAIMRCWYKKESPRILDDSVLPLHVKKERNYWRKSEREIYILKMNSNYGNVYLAVIVSNQYPCFVCGSAACLTNEKEDIQRTVYKALQEAEYCLYSILEKPDYDLIKPESVWYPNDHGKLYHQKKYKDSIRWLWSGEITHQLCEDECVWEYELLKKELRVCKAALIDSGPLDVVRVLSPKLVPISFGYNNSHHLHPEIIFECKQNNDIPHFFS